MCTPRRLASLLLPLVSVLAFALAGCGGVQAVFGRGVSPSGLSTPDHQIQVPALPASDWDCTVSSSEQPAQQVQLVKCRDRSPGAFFFMMAKDYSVPLDEVLTAEELATKVYPAHHEQLFEGVEYTFSGSAMHQGHLAHDVSLRAWHPTRGAIHKVERVVVSGQHVMVISGEGAPDDLRAASGELDEWFRLSRFARLG